MAPRFDTLAKLFKGVDKDLTINWHAIVAASSTSIHLSPSGKCLNGVFLAWCKANDGFPVVSWNYDRQQYPNAHERLPQKGDQHITAGEAAAPDFHHPGMWKDRVGHWEDWAKAEAGGQAQKVELLLPAYDVKFGYLLLDGAHRSVAILRAKVDYTVELAVIRGPIDEYVLKDLARFS